VNRSLFCTVFSASMLAVTAPRGRASAEPMQPQTLPTPPTTPEPEPAVERRAREWFHRVQTGDIDRSQLSPEANAALTPAIVDTFKTKLGPLGAPSSFALFRKEFVEDKAAYVYLAKFPKSKVELDWVFALDKTGRVAGLRLSSAQ
jgi:hypothetical protein